MSAPAVTIRVVKPPTTGELLDAFYRERNMIHGSNVENRPSAVGCRRVAAKGRT